MKKLGTILSLMMTMFLLAACGNSDNLGKSNTDKKEAKTQLTGQTTTDYYRGVIKNGRYQVSKSRGVNLQQEANQFNIRGFESGLLDISKQNFSTKKYVFQEGQELDTGLVEKWLGRKSKSNPQGLNPVASKSTNPNTRTPNYLDQINEQDFMVQSGSELKLSGMTIGLALNSIDYYKKEKYGPTYETHISNQAMRKAGQKIANRILKRIRAQKGLANIPVVIALYKQTSNDSLVGGNFFSYSVNKAGATKVNKWEKVNQKSYVFPMQSAKKGAVENDLEAFDNFKSQVEGFFPNLSGVTAQVRYTDGALSSMNVNITTQFYSQTEVISFTQYIQDAAQKYLPANAPINILVQSSDSTQSFLSRKVDEKKFTANILNTY